jgi:hypothetical protein
MLSATQRSCVKSKHIEGCNPSKGSPCKNRALKLSPPGGVSKARIIDQLKRVNFSKFLGINLVQDID